MRRLFTLLLAAALFALRCDFPSIFDSDKAQPRTQDENTFSDRVRIDMEIIGGFASVHQRLTVAEDGRATVTGLPDLPVRWDHLSPGEVQGLAATFFQNGFLHLRDAYASAKDQFAGPTYVITFSYEDVTKTVQADEASAPLELQNIIETLRGMMVKIANNGLALELRLSADTIHVGESVTLKLTVANRKDDDLTLQFTSGQVFDFYAQAARFEVTTVPIPTQPAWSWSHDRAFTQIVWAMPLRVSEERAYEVTWDGKSSTGEQMVGEVLITAELNSTPGGRTNPVPLLIISQGLNLEESQP